MTTTIYQVRMWREGRSVKCINVEAETLDGAQQAAIVETEEWTAAADWGDAGARIECGCEILADAGEIIARGHGVVEIAPDHAALITAALRASSRTAACCGTSPADHEWTSDGYTTVVHASHCRQCGLRLIETRPKTQANPWPVATFEYSYPAELAPRVGDAIA